MRSGRGGSGVGEELVRLGARPLERPRAGERLWIEAPRSRRHELPGGEVARVERLQRMADQHLIARRAAVGADRPIDDVEQLADRNGGRAAEVRALVVPGVGDDQPFGRRHQRVEEHLAILRARVAIADVRVLEHQVVAVAPGAARELAVVEAEDADDAVRHRAHRHERAHGQVPGAEVRARRPAAQPVGEQRADVGQLELGAASGDPFRPESATTSSSMRWSSRSCQASRSLVAVSASAALAIALAQALIGLRWSARRRPSGPARRTRRGARRARSRRSRRRRAGARRRSRRRSSSVIATPTRIRSRPAAPRVGADRSRA